MISKPSFIQNNQKKVPLSISFLENQAKKILAILRKNKKHRLTRQTEVNFQFIDDSQMRKWHKKYLGKSQTTDVISFSMREGSKIKEDILGDVLISAQVAQKNAKRFKKSFEEELILYMIHGVLHLLGYDDLDPKKKKKMDQLQFDILEKVKRDQ